MKSSTPDKLNEELREAVADLPFDGKGLIHSLAANMEPEYFDVLLDWIAQHTKEVVRRECLKARMDENRLARNAMEPNEALGVPYVPSFDLYTSNRNHELELELAAPTASPQQPKPLEEK